MSNRGLKIRLWAVLLLLAATTWVGCVPRERLHGVKTTKVTLEKPHSLALLKFFGLYGTTVRSHIYDRLVEVQHLRPIDNCLYPDLDKVVFDELHDPNSIASLEALEADGAVTGSVIASIHDSPGTDQVQVKEGTGHYKKEKNIDGQWVDVEIKRTVIRTLPYVIRKASLSTEYKVLDLSTKRIVASGKLSEGYEEKFGGDNEYASLGHKLSDFPDASVTVDELSARVASRLVEKLSHIKLTGSVKE